MLMIVRSALASRHRPYPRFAQNFRREDQLSSREIIVNSFAFIVCSAESWQDYRWLRLGLVPRDFQRSTFYQITQPQRVSFSTNLRALGIKIVIAYFLNNTSTTNGVEPSFWYTGPSPPNEQDLQDPSTVAANLTG